MSSPPAERTPAWALALLGLLLAAGGAVLLYLTRGTTFFQDEWSWILARRSGVGSLIHPYNQHLSLIPVAIYRVLFAVAGLRHYWPYRAVSLAAELSCVTLIFFYARRRVGPWLALLAAALIMFFGPGWQDMLWPFQMAWLITVAAGLGVLLALDRRDLTGEVMACVLLCVAVASASPGLAVLLGVTVEVLRTRRPRWIVAVPILLYAIWWLAFEQSSILGDALLLLPRFVFDAAAGVLSTLTGVASINVSTDTGNYLTLGPALLVVALVLIGARLRRWGRIPPRVLTLILIPLAFWIVAGAARAATRVDGVILHFTGDEGRYLYIGAVWVLLLAIELIRGARPGRWTLALATVLTGAIVLANVSTLRDGAGLLRAQAQVTRAELGTLDMTRGQVAPSFASSGFVFFANVTARDYFAAERALGTFGATPSELAGYANGARAVADAQLVRIHQPTLTPVAPDPTRRCLEHTASGRLVFVLPRSGLTVLSTGAPAVISLRRFASTFAPLGTLAPGHAGRLLIRGDEAPQPWHVQVASSATIRICSA
jgi:hypothetical protein